MVKCFGLVDEERVIEKKMKIVTKRTELAMLSSESLWCKECKWRRVFIHKEVVKAKRLKR